LKKPFFVIALSVMISLYGLTPAEGLCPPPGPEDLVESVCGLTCATLIMLKQSIVKPKKIRRVVFLM
jgi:hypothetical protein